MKKTISIVTIVMMLLAIITSNVYAAGQTFAISLSADNKEVNQSGEVTLILNVKDFENMTDGLMGYTAKIEYDTSFFETLTQESFSAKGTWSVPTFNPITNLLTADSATGVKTNSDVFTVKFKVKENALIGASTTISIKDFTAAEGDAEIKAKEVASVSLTVKAKDNQQEQPENTTNTINNGINIIDNTINNNNTTKNTINTSGNTANLIGNNTNTAGGNIPQTGEQDWIFIAIVATLVVGVVSYLRYRNMK